VHNTPKNSHKIKQGIFYVFPFYYIEKFINEEQQGSVTLCVAAQDVNLDFAFGPCPVLSLTGQL
jgi:hypothetical protein